MHYRPLGETGIQASVVGMGAWAIGGWMWGGTDEKLAIQAIHAGLDAGMTLLDTAPVYGFGRSEEICGKAIKGRRSEVVLATKCGLVWHVEKGDHFFDSDDKHPGRGHEFRVFRYLGKESIRHEVEQSLKRLKTDHIDLYQTHWQETTTPIEETMEALLKLQEEGKIRAIGVSNVNVGHLEQYRRFGVIASAQEKFSMLDQSLMAELIPYCEKNHLAVLAYSPLAQGLLTGKIKPGRTFEEGDQRAGRPRFSEEVLKKIAGMFEVIEPIAESLKASATQVVIAWTVSQPGVTHALCGVRNEEQAFENSRAGDLVLSQEDIARITKAIEVHAAGV